MDMHNDEKTTLSFTINIPIDEQLYYPCTIKAKQVSDFFIKKSLQTVDGITPLKVQQLLYFSYVWYLKLYGTRTTRLFEEVIYANVYGARVQSEYDRLKWLGNNIINGEVMETNTALIPKRTEEFLNMTWDIYHKYSSNYLIEMVCKGTPWINATKTEDNIIKDSEIQDYYTNERLATFLSKGHLSEFIGLPKNIVATQNDDGDSMIVGVIGYDDYDNMEEGDEFVVFLPPHQDDISLTLHENDISLFYIHIDNIMMLPISSITLDIREAGEYKFIGAFLTPLRDNDLYSIEMYLEGKYKDIAKCNSKEIHIVLGTYEDTIPLRRLLQKKLNPSNT